jgi:antitoxin PrlF
MHMPNIRAKVAEDGIVIPAEYLQALGLQVGDDINLRMEDGVLHILTLQQAIVYAQELVRSYVPEGRSLSEDLIEERRREE